MSKMLCFNSLLLFFGLSLAISSALEIKIDIKEDSSDVDTTPFTRIGNNYYFFESTLKKNWFDAYESCRKFKAELITLETLEEFDLIAKYLKENNINKDYWSSATDLANDREFVWFTNADPVLPEFWLPGEPNNSEGKPENCADLRTDNAIDKPSSIRLNDARCLYLNHYICEKSGPLTASLVVW